MSNSGGSGSRRKGGGSGGNSGKAPAADSIAGVLNTFAQNTKDMHRTSFLMFLQRVTVRLPPYETYINDSERFRLIVLLQGVEVDVEMADGRNYRGVFYTATPFHNKKFELALKAAVCVDSAGAVVPDPDPAVGMGSTVLLAFSDLKALTVSKKKVTANEGMGCRFFPCPAWLFMFSLSLI